MGECIGLDFGTTYSVVAYLDKRTSGEAGTPTPIDFGGEEKSITSMETMVVHSKGVTRIGYEAVPVMRVKGAEVFKGFKMLLNSTDEQEKSRRGYTGNNTPEAITSTFMTELFKKVWNAAPDCREIDKVVVGVPYVWTQNGEDSRKFELADIVKQATGAEIVEFQSEPTLACAYFVQEINKKRVEEGKAHFDGYILVIDYGGGTLDVTLCKADEQDGKSNIKVCNSWGAGENTEGQIGSAGLAYMERVADLLLEENGITNVSKEDKDYQAFVKYIEVAIKDQSGHLKDCINRAKRYFTPGGARYEEEIDGISAYYKGEEYFVKYRTLIQAYDESIRPILTRVLNEAKEEMKEQKIPYDDDKNGTFKIATIGGFCNFALTENQIRNDTDWLRSHHKTLDTRYSELDETVRPKNRELAIAYGASLNANDVVEIKKQFPYTLCFYPIKGYKKENGVEIPIADETEEFIMFCEGEEFVPGKPVFFGEDETGEDGGVFRRPFPVSGDSIPLIRRKKKKKMSPIKEPVKEMVLPGRSEGGIYIAMAMERNENLTLYTYDAVIYEQLSEEEKETPVNRALIGNPAAFPNIDKLLGSFYIVREEK